MSEEWQMYLLTGLLGWIAWEIRTLRHRMEQFVTRHDCEKDMDGHCARLNNLTQKVEENETEIAKLKSKAEVWHKED